MLLLIDTRDDRPPPDPEGPRRWSASLRPVLPFVEAAACLTMAGMVPPLPCYALVVASLGLVGHGALALMPDRDGLRDHHQ